MATLAAGEHSGPIEPTPGQRLERSQAVSQLGDDRMELIELLAQSMAQFEMLKANILQAQQTREEANAQLVALDAAVAPTPLFPTNNAGCSSSSPSSSSSALHRARSVNAENLHKLRAQLEDALSELASEKARRISAEEKLVALQQNSAAPASSIPPALALPSRSSINVEGEGSTRSVELELERMHLETQQSIGDPSTPGKFVQSAVAGALAGTASNAVKLLNTMVPRSPSREASHGTKATDRSEQFSSSGAGFDGGAQ